MTAATEQRESWGGRTTFIVAAISSAIGLGNIWRFPGVAYENGGGAFLIPYAVAFLTAGIPILFLDYAVGHRYRASAPLAYRRLDRRMEPVGWLQVASCFIIALYYSVVIAWALGYTARAFTQAWGDDAPGYFITEVAQTVDPGFNLDFAAPVLIPLLAVWALAVAVLCLGIKRGLRVANRITLPVLVVVFTGIVAYSLTLDGAIDGVNAFFTPSWAALGDVSVWLAAYGHIFFSFSIAFGVMVTYSSYVGRKADLTGSGAVVAFGNCSFEILAGIGVFATLGFLASQQATTVGELEGIEGVGLAFMTFPTLLSQMPGGTLVGVLFFFCLVVAGFTSLLSILQVVSAAVQDKFGLAPARAGLLVGLTAAVPSVLIFSTTNGLNALDVVDAFINNIGVVGSAILMLVMIGWMAAKLPLLSRHLNAVSSLRTGPVWSAMIRFVTPAILLVVLGRGAWDYLTDGYDGESYPRMFEVYYGWLVVALVVLFAVVMTLRPFARPDAAEAYRPEDPEALAAECERDRAQLQAELTDRRDR